MIMDIKKIKEELIKVQNAPFAKKSDKQLISYEVLSELYKNQNNGIQPAALAKYNKPVNRNCKLTIKDVIEIKKKYNPYVYGKQKLAKEYGVSTSVVYRIIKGRAWKIYDDSC
jgi:Mor family transcriptional regulator